MRFFTTTDTLDDFVGNYGNDRFRRGIVVDHVPAAIAAGHTYRRLTRSAVVVDSSGRTAPVLCGEIIRVDTEDGPVSGRCGGLANLDGLCDRHSF